MRDKWRGTNESSRMTENEEKKPAPPSQMSITARNALIGLLIAVLVAVLLGSVYGVMSIVMDLTTNANIDIWIVLIRAIYVLKSVGMCIVPIVFIFAFALLQRFRIK